MRINQAINLCMWSHGGKHSRLGSGSKWSVDTKQIRRYGRVPSQESFILNKHRGHFWGQITVCSPLSKTNKSENLQNLCKSVGTINLIDTTISGSTWMQPSFPLLGQLAIHSLAAGVNPNTWQASIPTLACLGHGEKIHPTVTVDWLCKVC